jgi:hypothetical protein
VTVSAKSGKKKLKPRDCLILSLILGAIGISGIWFFSARPYLKYRDVPNWERVSCRILSSSIDRVGRRSRRRWKPLLEYEYTYDGETYSSDALEVTSFLATSYGKLAAESLVDEFEPDSEAGCYVNPADPSESVLLHKLQRNWWLPGLVGGFFLFAAFALLLGAWRLKRQGA